MFKNHLNLPRWPLSWPLSWTYLLLGASTHSIASPYLDSIQHWTGEGSNRAAIVIHWKAPLVQPTGKSYIPSADLSMVWGYRWEGEVSAEQALREIAASDPRLYLVVSPETQFGVSLLGIGWDANQNQVWGINRNNQAVPGADFDSGAYVVGFDQADQLTPLDPADVFWSGWNGPFWEVWTQSGSSSGISAAVPDRGSSKYWTPSDEAGFSGSHGDWELAGFGLSGVTLQDGDWVGLSVAAGSFLYLEPDSADTLAYFNKKQAPRSPKIVEQQVNPSARQVDAFEGAFGQDPYNDPQAVLGFPARDFYDPFAELEGDSPIRKSSVIDAPYYKSVDESEKLLLTLLTQPDDSPELVILEMDPPVLDDPDHPYGVDFLVFGNSFLASEGYVGGASNLEEVQLTQGAFEEPLLVSVSPGFQGLEGESASDWRTWRWESYTNGPFADTMFPTQGYEWDSTVAEWSRVPTDFTLPVNPELTDFLQNGSRYDLTAADAIAWYSGSGGGTGFDLSDVGLSKVRYIQVSSSFPNFYGGEIDAAVSVRPLYLGDRVVVVAEEILSGDAISSFKSASDLSQRSWRIQWTEVSERIQFQWRVEKWTEPESDLTLGSTELEFRGVVEIPGSDSMPVAKGFLSIPLDHLNPGRATSSRLYYWNTDSWERIEWDVDPATLLATTTQPIALDKRFRIVTLPDSLLVIHQTEDSKIEITFETVAGVQYQLMWSMDGVRWEILEIWLAESNQEQVYQTETTREGTMFFRLQEDFANQN